MIVAIDEQEGIHRGCGWFQTLKDDTNPVLKRDRCTEAKIAYDGLAKAIKLLYACAAKICAIPQPNAPWNGLGLHFDVFFFMLKH